MHAIRRVLAACILAGLAAAPFAWQSAGAEPGLSPKIVPANPERVFVVATLECQMMTRDARAAILFILLMDGELTDQAFYLAWVKTFGQSEGFAAMQALAQCKVGRTA